MNAVPGQTLAPDSPKFHPAPLLPLSLGVIFGIVVDDLLEFPFSSLLLICVVIVSLAIMSLRLRRGSIVAATIAIGFAFGGMRHFWAARYIPANAISTLVASEPQIVKITGVVVGAPRIVEQDPLRRYPYPIQPKTRFTLRTESISAVTGEITTSGLLTATVKEPMLFLESGQRIRMTGRLYRPMPPSNPGEFDWSEYLRANGIYAGISTDHASAVAILESSAPPSIQFIDSIRRGAEKLLMSETATIDEENAGVVAAMVLGRRSQVDRTLNEAFVRTGSAHFLAASGMHVGWLALIGWWLTRFFGMHYRAGAVVVAIMIVMYVVLAEPRPSILRAGVIGVLGCLGIIRRGRINILNWLALSAIVTLTFRPTDLFSPAFQLSFVAVLAIVYLQPIISARITETIPLFRGVDERLKPVDSAASMPLTAALPATRRVVTDHVLAAIRLAVSASIAVWIANVPIATYHFDQFAPWGWLFNLLLIFPAFLLTAIGFLKVAIGLLLPSSSLIFGPLLDWCSDFFIRLVNLLAALPGTLLHGNHPSLIWVFAVYFFLGVLILRPSVFLRRRYSLAASILVLLVWWQIPHRLFTVDRGNLNVWMLAVGDGTGTVIELPDGRTMLFDFGTRTPINVADTANSFLRNRGIREIDTAFVSHANWDHYGAIEEIAYEYPVGRVVLNEQFDLFVEDKSGGWWFKRRISERDISTDKIARGQTWTDASGVKFEVLWPPEGTERPAPSANDGSLALRLSWRGKAILLTGDQAEWGLAGLIDTDDLACDVLALPHHGSVVHNTTAFIDATDAAICVRSTGQRSAMTTNGIEQIVGSNRKYFSTADDGCVRVQIGTDGIVVSSHFDK